MRAVIGIDTSCYTTSFAAVDENGKLNFVSSSAVAR